MRDIVRRRHICPRWKTVGLSSIGSQDNPRIAIDPQGPRVWTLPLGNREFRALRYPSVTPHPQLRGGGGTGGVDHRAGCFFLLLTSVEPFVEGVLRVARNDKNSSKHDPKRSIFLVRAFVAGVAIMHDSCTSFMCIKKGSRVVKKPKNVRKSARRAREKSMCLL